MTRIRPWRLGLAAFAALVLGVVGVWAGVEAVSGDDSATGSSYPNWVLPAPVSAVATKMMFNLPANASITTDAPDVGDYLAKLLRASTGYPIPVSAGGDGTIQLLLSGAPAKVGTQGYELSITKSNVVIKANKSAGLFAGVQTLRQLMPPAVEGQAVKRPISIPGGVIVDYPRFAYRGAMLDVARHFFTVSQVERYIDEISLYKINYLHLHLTDDQGWRIAINGWPALTEIGGSTQVGGGPGGYYTQADYSAIVDYAASRYITVIPEIDMPGHTNAALASYAGLNCKGVAPKPYRGVDVGFSSLCVSLPKTYDFVDQVVGQLAGLTPGPYIHIGGDESTATNDVDYAKFIERAQQIVVDHGKTAIGWHDVATAKLLPSTVAEFWDTSKQNAPTASAVASGTKVIMAPANHTYLDMKYNPGTTLGTSWAAMYDVNEAYGWNPGAYLEGVGESAVLGVEAPLWTETIVTPDDIDYMAFPRLPAIAELGWSPWSTHNEAAFLDRMAAQEPLWRAMGIHFYPSQQVRWAPQP